MLKVDTRKALKEVSKEKGITIDALENAIVKDWLANRRPLTLTKRQRKVEFIETQVTV